MAEPTSCGIGSFGKMKACFNAMSEKPPTMESIGNTINGAVLEAAQKTGLTEINPLEAAKDGVVGRAIKTRQQANGYGG